MPDNRRTEYFEWMRNIRDWLHFRGNCGGVTGFPAWHCGGCKEIIVAARLPKSARSADRQKLIQDPDVLGDVVQLGAMALFDDGMARRHAGLPEILSDQFAGYRVRHSFLLGRAHDHDWAEITGQVPFRQVWMHSIVRNAEGQKMSKSKGTESIPWDEREIWN